MLAVAGYGLEGGRGWPPALAGLGLAGAIIYYNWRHKTDPLSPLFMGLCRVLVYVTAALAVAPKLPGPVLWGAAMLLAYLIGLTYAAKQESLGRVEGLWPLALLAAPLAYLLTILPAAPDGSGTWLLWLLYLGFLAWVGYALFHLVRRGRANVPLAVGTLIAGISFLDALLIGSQGELGLAWLAAGGAVLTRLLQRFVPGT
jgi:4-hydroxybenzoate polyprenyltransferase